MWHVRSLRVCASTSVIPSAGFCQVFVVVLLDCDRASYARCATIDHVPSCIALRASSDLSTARTCAQSFFVALQYRQ